MNVELKAILTILFAFGKLAKDVVEKAGITQNIADLEVIAVGIPAAVSNFSDLQAEISALESNPAAMTDILAFIGSQFTGISGDAHAQAILSAACKLIADIGVDGTELVKAIKG